ncbi:hypothetical protein, partial [Endozoicomonas acroporae]|uniref:hypothetical protein n=1 Tax=Endozoicomonas acroporae TaxID=1701104 RepID=UPI003D7AE06C
MNSKADFSCYSPVKLNRDSAIDDALKSDLLSLAYTSDVNDPDPAQFERAQHALSIRDTLVEQGLDPASVTDVNDQGFLKLCEEIVREHLASREDYFGPEQCAPLDGAEDMAGEGRDTFLIIKFMDEEPHIRATLDSLLGQQGIDHNRLVIVAADNKSRDRSAQIVK